MSEEKSYYKDNLPILVEKLKKVCKNLLEIIEQDFDTDLSDDKLFNALKGKRQAADDYIYNLKRIDDLENEILGKSIDENDETPSTRNFAKERAARNKQQQE